MLHWAKPNSLLLFNIFMILLVLSHNLSSFAQCVGKRASYAKYAQSGTTGRMSDRRVLLKY